VASAEWRVASLIKLEIIKYKLEILVSAFLNQISMKRLLICLAFKKATFREKPAPTVFLFCLTQLLSAFKLGQNKRQFWREYAY